MIVEHATIKVKPGSNADFEAAIETAKRDVLPKAEGCHGLVLHRCVEEPDTYIAAISWDSVDHHMVTFRESPLFTDWRALVGPFFAEPPSVLHYDVLG